jgi:hypothetical protein
LEHNDEIIPIESISFEDIRLTQMQAVNQMDSMHKQKPVGSGRTNSGNYNTTN